jgi:hypothetical protein
VKTAAALCLIIWGTGLAFVARGNAQTIPDATGLARVDLPGIEKIDRLNTSVSSSSFALAMIGDNFGPVFGTGTVMAEFNSSTTPFVASGYSTQKSFAMGGQGKSFLNYYVEIQSRLTTSVAVDVSASGGARAALDNESAFAFAGFVAKAEFIFDKNGTEAVSGEASANQTVGSSSFNVNQMLALETNHPYLVEISTITSGALFGDSSLSAFVDPTFRIAPTVQNPADFAIAFSPNLTPVPEASPLLLVSSGLALAAFTRVLRKARVGRLAETI